jgi:glycosyltransferase involved in cell wall biosynthesis
MIEIRSINQTDQLPFFSVCIEMSDRGTTIFRCLESLANQKFRDFECVIVDDLSKDESVREVLRFVDSDVYEKSPFPVRLYQNEVRKGGVKNWNEPLLQAKGKYIAGLEGDDYYSPTHLQSAHTVLSADPSIGIYACGSQRGLFPVNGLIPSSDYLLYLYKIISVPPPSQGIFIRQKKDKSPYLFDVETNVYAPEHDLWFQIAADGYNVYHAATADVYREKGASQTHLTWKYFEDKFRNFSRYRTLPGITENIFREAFRRQFLFALRKYTIGINNGTGDPHGIEAGLRKVLEKNDTPSAAMFRTMLNTVVLLNKSRFPALYFGAKKMFRP